MKRTIKITQEDIDSGIKLHIAYCPIGRAMMREFKIAEDDERIVQAGTNWLYVLPNRKTYASNELMVARARTPDEAKKFILDFDKGKPVKPFELVVDFEEPENNS